MNLPIRLLLIAGLLTLCGSFRPVSHATIPSPAASASPRTVLYYLYTYPDDVYNDHLSLQQETYEWWVFYGGIIGIDTDPIGGTIIARGYNNNYYPHYNFPTAYLYAHFGY
jgi:hypothetical protein